VDSNTTSVTKGASPRLLPCDTATLSIAEPRSSVDYDRAVVARPLGDHLARGRFISFGPGTIVHARLAQRRKYATISLDPSDPWPGVHDKALIIDRRVMVTSGSAGVQQQRLRPLHIFGSRSGVFKALAGKASDFYPLHWCVAMVPAALCAALRDRQVGSPLSGWQRLVRVSRVESLLDPAAGAHSRSPRHLLRGNCTPRYQPLALIEGRSHALF